MACISSNFANVLQRMLSSTSRSRSRICKEHVPDCSLQYTGFAHAALSGVPFVKNLSGDTQGYRYLLRTRLLRYFCNPTVEPFRSPVRQKSLLHERLLEREQVRPDRLHI